MYISKYSIWPADVEAHQGELKAMGLHFDFMDDDIRAMSLRESVTDGKGTCVLECEKTRNELSSKLFDIFGQHIPDTRLDETVIQIMIIMMQIEGDK